MNLHLFALLLTLTLTASLGASQRSAKLLRHGDGASGDQMLRHSGSEDVKLTPKLSFATQKKAVKTINILKKISKKTKKSELADLVAKKAETKNFQVLKSPGQNKSSQKVQGQEQKDQSSQSPDQKGKEKKSKVQGQVLGQGFLQGLDPELVSELHRLISSYALRNESKQINIGGLTLSTPFTAALTSVLTALGGNLSGANLLTGGLGGLAAAGAGLAAGLAFLVPPLAVVNQVLAVIALAMLGVYIFEDEHVAEVFDGYIYDTTGLDWVEGESWNVPNGLAYGEVQGNHLGNTYGNNRGKSYGNNKSHSAGNSHGNSPGSSYTSYKSTADGGKDTARSSYGHRRGRSMAPPPLVSRVAGAVRRAVREYSILYGDKEI